MRRRKQRKSNFVARLRLPRLGGRTIKETYQYRISEDENENLKNDIVQDSSESQGNNDNYYLLDEVDRYIVASVHK